MLHSNYFINRDVIWDSPHEQSRSCPCVREAPCGCNSFHIYAITIIFLMTQSQAANQQQHGKKHHSRVMRPAANQSCCGRKIIFLEMLDKEHNFN